MEILDLTHATLPISGRPIYPFRLLFLCRRVTVCASNLFYVEAITTNCRKYPAMRRIVFELNRQWKRLYWIRYKEPFRIKVDKFRINRVINAQFKQTSSTKR